jgi:hypothetical protein
MSISKLLQLEKGISEIGMKRIRAWKIQVEAKG